MIKKISAVLLCLCLMAAGLYTLKAISPDSVFGQGTSAGSADDPVVTKSYVDQKLYEKETSLKQSIDALGGRVSALESGSVPENGSASGTGAAAGGSSGSGKDSENSSGGQTSAADVSEYEKYLKFIVVEVPENGRLIGSMGTEMILRAGTAVAIDNGADGITDLSSGADLKGGDAVTKNHLIIIPRTDGRGILCTGYCYVMVKGEYSIQ